MIQIALKWLVFPKNHKIFPAIWGFAPDPHGLLRLESQSVSRPPSGMRLVAPAFSVRHLIETFFAQKFLNFKSKPFFPLQNPGCVPAITVQILTIDVSILIILKVTVFWREECNKTNALFSGLTFHLSPVFFFPERVPVQTNIYCKTKKK